VNPPIYDFAAFDLWAKPLGMLYVAAALEREGHEVRVLDCLDRFHPRLAACGKGSPRPRRYGTGSYYWRPAAKPACYSRVPRAYKRFGLPDEVVREELTAVPAPDVIGVTSGMTYWYPGVVEIVRTLRGVFPQTPIVLGGIYATLCSEHARETVNPDYLVAGPGEAPMADIIRGLAGGGARPDRAIDRAGAAVDALPAAERAGGAFSDAPNPAYHLLRKVDSVSVLTGRGCPFACAYCASRILAPVIERREPGAVVEEIAGYRARFGIRDVAFHDDALLWEPERHIKPILRGIIAKGLDLRFHTPNGLQARMIDGELAALMKRAGFVTVRLSLETVAPERQADWAEKVCYDDFLAAAGCLKKAGFATDDIGAYIMIGLPGETSGEAARNIAAVHAAGVLVRLAEYSPIPGTDYFETARRESPVDITEPLLQNNSVISAGGIGSYAKYEALKAFAGALNRELASGRTIFSASEIDGASKAAVGMADFRT
jgi:radical SAM superfamily enzyme YgiQ (UPF0313 family)